jgi:hypothetical protein
MMQTPSDLVELDFEHRSAARSRHADRADLVDLFALERRIRTELGEGPEPEGLC